jgi:phosphoribosylformylglycinamidine synthase
VTSFHLEIRVKPRPGLLDPEGKAVHHALESLGFPEVSEVRVGKVIDLDVKAESQLIAIDRASEMCRKLLANPVTEDFQVTVLPELDLAAEIT